MAQNIVIAGATFNAVPSIVVPTSGNGTAVFVDPSPTTATDSDVASGKIYFKADGTQSTGTASGGGGGASNVVTGTFKGTAKGAMDINLPYTGNGYPIAVFAWVKDGPGNVNSDFYTTIARYAVNITAHIKRYPSIAPGYHGSGDADDAFRLLSYKNNSSGSTTYSQSNSSASHTFYNVNASAGNNSHLTIRSKTKLSVYIAEAGNYGFQQDIEYSYVVVYSS